MLETLQHLELDTVWSHSPSKDPNNIHIILQVHALQILHSIHSDYTTNRNNAPTKGRTVNYRDNFRIATVILLHVRMSLLTF